MTQTCENCKFYNEYSGQCYRYPPQVHLSPINDNQLDPQKFEVYSDRPWVNKTDFCGEFVKRE